MARMEDPNEAFCGPRGNGHEAALDEFTLGPGQSMHHVSTPSSSSNNHRKVHGRRQTNLNPSTGGFKTEANAEDIWNTTQASDNISHNFSESINVQGSRWPPAVGFGNEYIQGYSMPEGLAHGLPTFPSSQGIGSSFEFGSAIGGVPNLGSSSSSSCRVNESSPNSIFGSFSSSIGPQDMMDMDVTDECFHSPSAFPPDEPSYHNPGAIPQALLSRSAMPRSAMHNFGITPGVVFSEAETVSPKMLNLKNVPSLPNSSSSESLPNPFRMESDSEVTSVVTVPQAQTLPSSAGQARGGSGSKINSAGRKQLPDKAPHSKAISTSNGPKRRHGGEASGDKFSAPSSKKSKAKTKASTQSQSQSESQTQPQSASHHRHHLKGGSDSRSKTTQGKASSSKAASSARPKGAAEESVTPPRSEKDEYLVQSKLAGMTYKEIRKNGGFTEAESTLRGRFRTLTKPKEARVRKPEFQEIDDKLLKRAVIKFTKDVGEITRDNVPWKLVSEYMSDHGGSYHFGYTTVRKRWEYLMATSDEQVKQDRLDHKFQS
ncbi:hypothetical protein SLS64_010133 [Diaporthe eres]